MFEYLTGSNNHAYTEAPLGIILSNAIHPPRISYLISEVPPPLLIPDEQRTSSSYLTDYLKIVYPYTIFVKTIIILNFQMVTCDLN